jgi:hypothetical protein
MRLKFELTDDRGTKYVGEVELIPKATVQSTDGDQPGSAEVTTKEGEIGSGFKFPDWFYAGQPTVAHAVAILLYELNVTLSSGKIAKIVSRAWKDIDLRNVSKILTTRGKWLYVYVEKDGELGYRLNDKGRAWVEDVLVPLYSGKS